MARLMDALGLAHAVTLLKDERLWAMSYGFARPRIAVSTGLCARLSDDELEAVLLHEEHHRRSHEPLRILLASVARSVLWFLPPAGRLLSVYRKCSELAADAYAMERVGAHPLARALWKLRGGAGRALPAAPFVSVATVLQSRVAQIERYPEPLPSSPSIRFDAWVLAGGVLAAASWALLCLGR